MKYNCENITEDAFLCRQKMKKLPLKQQNYLELLKILTLENPDLYWKLLLPLISFLGFTSHCIRFHVFHVALSITIHSLRPDSSFTLADISQNQTFLPIYISQVITRKIG